MKSMYKIIFFTCITLIIAAKLFAWPFRVLGDCMEPAIKDGNRYLLNRALPYLRNYKIDDIVTFKYEGREWISRVVALENDTIQLTEGNIVVNGSTLDDNGIARDWYNWKYGTYAIDKPLQVPTGHVFVLSDKLSAHHDDSRVFGPIPKEFITGIVW